MTRAIDTEAEAMEVSQALADELGGGWCACPYNLKANWYASACKGPLTMKKTVWNTSSVRAVYTASIGPPRTIIAFAVDQAPSNKGGAREAIKRAVAALRVCIDKMDAKRYASQVATRERWLAEALAIMDWEAAHAHG